MKVEAPTSAMADVFASYEDKLAEFFDKLQLIEWQVGAVFAINSKASPDQGALQPKNKRSFQDPVVFTVKSFRFSTCQVNLLPIIALHI